MARHMMVTRATHGGIVRSVAADVGALRAAKRRTPAHAQPAGSPHVASYQGEDCRQEIADKRQRELDAIKDHLAHVEMFAARIAKHKPRSSGRASTPRASTLIRRFCTQLAAAAREAIDSETRALASIIAREQAADEERSRVAALAIAFGTEREHRAVEAVRAGAVEGECNCGACRMAMPCNVTGQRAQW